MTTFALNTFSSSTAWEPLHIDPIGWGIEVKTYTNHPGVEHFTPRMSILRVFPTEIWLLILEDICRCPHCLGSIYDFDLSTYEQAKSDLLSLSLTCRDMRNVAQQVLYHCFYGYPFKNTLSKFLRTLIFQPQLARHVRALILPETLDKQFVLENESKFLTRSYIGDCLWAASEAGIGAPAWLLHAFTGDASSDVAEYVGPGREQLRLKNPERQHGNNSEYHVFMRGVRLWQQLLTVRLVSPGISHMGLVELNSGLLQYSFDFVDPTRMPLSFPNLRTVSWSLVRSHEEFHQLFHNAPRLESITLGTTFGPDWISPQWKLPPSCTNVNALSIACSAAYQGYILQACNQVQELELHLVEEDLAQWEAGTIEPPELLTLRPWPAHIKSHLRRLCWSSTAPYLSANYLPTVDEGLNLFPPLADFRSLEILEIDRLALDICVMRDRGSDMPKRERWAQLPTILPRTLRALRLMVIEELSWSWLILDLEALALAKDTFLPKLSVVQIDWDPRMMTLMPQNEKSLPEVMFDLGVTKAMGDVGIELRFGFKSFLYRGLVRPMPANLDSFSRGWGLLLP